MPDFDPVTRLREHVASLSSRRCSRSEFIDIMRQARLVLEKERLNDTYPHLALFCDWLLHTEIDRHQLVLKLLEEMHGALADFDKTRNIQAVSQRLNLAAFRAETLVFFTSHKISTNIPDSFANWNAFVGVLLEEFCDRPLRLPAKLHGKSKKRISEAIDRMKAKWASNTPMWARAFYLTLDREKNPPVLSWNLENAAPFLVGADKIIMKGVLQNTETVGDFLRP